MTDFPRKYYYIKSQSHYWNMSIFLGIFFTPIIIYAFYTMVFKSDLVEGINIYWLLGAVLINYFLANFLAKKLTHYSLLHISYNKKEITVDYVKKDKQTIDKSSSYLISDISRFDDFNLGSDKTFKLEFNNGKTFALYGEEGYKESGELERLIKDFKSDIKLNDISSKSNTKTTKHITYHNFYNSLWGKILLVISCIALLVGIGFAIYVGYLGYINSPQFEWRMLKLPVLLLAFSSAYLAGYLNQDGDN